MHFTNSLTLCAATVAMTIPTVIAAGNFAATCSSIFLPRNNFLQATCGDGRGGQTTSQLNLDACIGIASTQLVCKANGNYAALGCAGCGIATGQFMRCGCPGGVKIADLKRCELSHTRVDKKRGIRIEYTRITQLYALYGVYQCVANIGGILTCAT